LRPYVDEERDAADCGHRRAPGRTRLENLRKACERQHKNRRHPCPVCRPFAATRPRQVRGNVSARFWKALIGDRALRIRLSCIAAGKRNQGAWWPMYTAG
jgi:hypothetical protein